MEPIITDLTKPMDNEQITSLVTSLIARKNVIDNNRNTAFGKTGGLMKGLLSNNTKAESDMKRSFDWFMAVANDDKAYLQKANDQYRIDWIEAYNNDELSRTEFKTLAPANEGTNSAGGYNVPLPFATELSRNLGNYGYARKYFRIMPMDRKSLAIAGLKTKPTVAVYAENAAIGASKPVLDQLVLTRGKLASIYAASNEYLEDANIDVLAAMIEIFAEQFGIAEDTNAFQNATTTWPGLLYYGAGTITSGIAANGAIAISRLANSAGGATSYPQNGDATAAKDLWTDMLNMMAQQPSALFQGAMFFMPQEVLIALLSMRDSSYRFIANLDMGLEIGTGLDGQPQLQYRGYPIVCVPSGIMITYDASAHVSSPFMAFCNPMRSWVCMGQRDGFTVDMSISGTNDTVNAFTNDLKLFRMKESIAFGCGRPETVTTLRTDAS